MKDSFLMYNSWAEMMVEMPPEELAQLSRAIACYQLGKDFSIDNPMVSAIFDMMRSQFDRDALKYEEKCEMNRENGKKGGRPKTERIEEEPNETERLLKKAKKAEYDYDYDNDYIKEKDTPKGVSKEKAPKRFSPPSLEEVSDYCSERGNSVDPERFVDFYASKGWKVGNNPMKDWKAAVRTWERREEQPRARSGTNKFHNFEERKTDLDKLEEQYFRQKLGGYHA